MTDLLLLVLLCLVAQNGDLLALAVLHDLGLHAGTLHNGSTDLGVLAIQHGQDLVELHGGLGLGVQLLDEEDVALGDGVLLATFICFTYFILCSLALRALQAQT